MSNEADVKL